MVVTGRGVHHLALSRLDDPPLEIKGRREERKKGGKEKRRRRRRRRKKKREKRGKGDRKKKVEGKRKVGKRDVCRLHPYLTDFNI